MVVNNKTGNGVNIWWSEGHLLLEQIVALQIYSVNSDPNIMGPLTHSAILSNNFSVFLPNLAAISD